MGLSSGGSAVYNRSDCSPMMRLVCVLYRDSAARLSGFTVRLMPPKRVIKIRRGNTRRTVGWFQEDNHEPGCE